MNYFWIRVFEYNYDRDMYDKGIMLDEYYLKDIDNREEAKKQVKQKYTGETSEKISFAKPRNKNGIYAVVMESNKFFYDRFYLEIDTNCFYCHKKINGKASEFPKLSLYDYGSNDKADNTIENAYFCSYECKYHLKNSLIYEGEFQEKEVGNSGSTFGYIYLMYNKTENKYYIGQTRYLPFFRWQEHIKDGVKGNITDIVFSVITEIKWDKTKDDTTNQIVLNNIEAWWIAKYKEEGYEVFNISNPRLTIDDYRKKFDEMISKNQQLCIV